MELNPQAAIRKGPLVESYRLNRRLVTGLSHMELYRQEDFLIQNKLY
jgi:hypothetical protein